VSGLWFCWLSLVVGLGSLDAWGSTKQKKGNLTELQSVRIDSSGQLILKFNKPVKALKTKTEALSGKVQFSFEDVFIRQAELFRFERAPISKVFAYQFAPKIVRLRLFSELSSEALMSKLAVRQEGFLWSIPLKGYLEPGPEVEAEALKEPSLQEVEKLEQALEKEMTEKSLPPQEKHTGMMGSVRFWTSLLSMSLLAFGFLILILSRRAKSSEHSQLRKNGEEPWFEILSKHSFDKGTEIWLVRVQSKVVALLKSRRSFQVMTEYEAELEPFEPPSLQAPVNRDLKAPWQPSPQLQRRIHSKLEGLKPL
jgi:hypothetical protein